MKKWIFILAGFLAAWILPISAAEIWVAPDGDDLHPGTREAPMATLWMAQRKAREMRRLNDPSVRGGITIFLKGGTWFLNETLFFRPEDSGTEESPTIIMSVPGERAVLSGGVTISSWKKAGRIHGLSREARGNIWMADIPQHSGNLHSFRQLWVNGRKADRASSLDGTPLPRILSVDPGRQEFCIPAPSFPTSDLAGMEMVIHQWWAIAVLRVKNIRVAGDSARISFIQPESRIEFEHPWPAPFIDQEKKLNGNSAYYFTNSISFLNRPGEWFHDKMSGKLYYWPREGEVMSSAEVIAPCLETLVSLQGTFDRPVTHLEFRGIGFEHTSWLRPGEAGHVPLQAGFFLLDAYKLKVPGTPDKASLENQAWIGRQPAAVQVTASSSIRFERCRFEHLAATGLDFIIGANRCTVQGCLFRDIGGTGIQSGFFGDAATEAHLPYLPSIEREMCRDILIADNRITDCSKEDWGCVGISVGFAAGVNIEHNEVSHLNYSGICVGWGWTPSLSCSRDNRVHANHIHHFARNMYDVGGIYTLGAQPGMEISNNYIHDLLEAPYAHIPDHYQYIYLDEGSSYIQVKNNRTEKEKFFSNTPGPGNVWENNGPDVTEEVIRAAGIREPYRDIQ
ncbi:MAG: right-handed parallel beta-helix repeat-containing protein [Bacteroidota bacterium]|jgi:hypothetical protein|nr:right-handed parallel beta-helix repeat-containing protein [Prolixibacteraceae bacterium]MDI9565105.1 right-handed parallel beta-helix repeat-containing protein [Bacteroidota bacterium]NLT00549.1 right-handed parallel beta-helix repeat-containing protein [Bacteroidales bacterium]OQB81270.1 MAG: hypothetical protein BWX87_00794 [Bacteroidetes bacterium ADurb.Bin123]HNZ68947.1 right-handed parallel beta-helix repeat-containing protein [Prolixibacteraceae bacterium]